MCFDYRPKINRNSNILGWFSPFTKTVFSKTPSVFYLSIECTRKVELKGLENGCLLETQDIWAFLAGRFPFQIYGAQHSVLSLLHIQRKDRSP